MSDIRKVSTAYTFKWRLKHIIMITQYIFITFKLLNLENVKCIQMEMGNTRSIMTTQSIHSQH